MGDWLYNSVNRIFPYIGSPAHLLYVSGLLFVGSLMEENQDTRYKTLKNGAVYDMEEKRIVSGAVLTSDGARALVQKREESRRAAVRAVANQNPKAAALAAAHGDLAYIAAITESAMVKATNPADPKMIEAANWITRVAGDDFGTDSGGDSSVEEVRGILRDLAGLARAVLEARAVEDNNNYLQS